MTYIVICGGYSPGARVLRAAVRQVSAGREIQVVTLCPALAGLPKAIEEIKSLSPLDTLVVDACEGGCALQGLIRFGVRPKANIILNKYPMVSDRNIKEAKERIEEFLSKEAAP
jgi:uncharacterized metal-binding protein